MRLFLLEITAFSAMLGYFQILARILDFKHSSNKLVDKKERSVSYCCSRATLKWIGRRSRYVKLPWQTNFCRISTKRGPASFFADEPKSINLELFEYSDGAYWLPAEEYVPGAARKGMEWQYFVGDCSDPAVQEQAKINFQNGLNAIFGGGDPNYCQREGVCALENIKVTCGKTQRRKRRAAQVSSELHNRVLAPVVQKLNSAIHRINHYPVDKYTGNQLRYLVDSDLSSE